MELFRRGGLAGLVYFVDYVKGIVSINLFGIWLLVDILLILVGWYVWGCKSTEASADIEKAQCNFWSFLCVVGNMW